MQRDFTLMAIEGLIGFLHHAPQISPKQNAGLTGSPNPARSITWNNTQWLTFILAIRLSAGKQNLLPMQPNGEVLCTYANIDDLIKNTGFNTFID